MTKARKQRNKADEAKKNKMRDLDPKSRGKDVKGGSLDFGGLKINVKPSVRVPRG